MAIPDEQVAQVRAATDIVALIGEHAALRQQGRQWVGLCPFHGEKTPSFSVNAETGVYYCHGCKAGGDAITFVREIEHLDFSEAVRSLADRVGIVLEEGSGDSEGRRKRKELLDAMESAVAWYHERLLSAPDAGPARDYLRSRGYDGSIARQFRLGWAPDDWDALSRSLKLSERVLSGTGLGFVNRRGRRQDAFRRRIIFPICDPSGHPIALGGRVLPKGEPTPDAERAAEPKYKNSQETVIYSKRRTLYALNWAKKDIIATGEVVVCEGYTDVIGCFQAGLPRAVATCGTALAEEHFKLLRNFGKRIVLAYDADSAGQSATGRIYEWESRHEVDVVVAELPTGSDPGELALKDPEALRAAVGAARPFLQFRLDRILEEGDLTTPEGRARAADRALTAISEHPDDFVRDQYVMQVADRCRLEPDRVRGRLKMPRPDSSSDSRPSSRSGSRSFENAARDRRDGVDGAAARPGLEALRHAVHRPDSVVDRLDAALFVDELERNAFLVLADATDLHQAIGNASPEVADLLRRLAVEEPVLIEGAAVDPADAVITQLVRVAARNALGELAIAARRDPGDLSIAEENARVRLWVEDLDDPAVGSEVTDRLLAWLIDRRED